MRISGLIALAFCFSAFAVSPAAASTSATFESGGRSIHYEIFGEKATGPILILLHGAGGPGIPFYPEQAAFYASKGYTVLLLHYFDSTTSYLASPANYIVWEKTIEDLVRQCRSHPEWSGRKIGVLGYSLGASVALSVASQLAPVDAVAEWYGSLPDEFFMSLKGMLPLLILHGQRDPQMPILNAQQIMRLCEMKSFSCDSHIYPDQGHGFQGNDLSDAQKRTLAFFAQKLR